MRRSARSWARQSEARQIEAEWEEQERLYEASTDGVQGLFRGLYTTQGGPLDQDEATKSAILKFLTEPSIETWSAVAFLEVQPTVQMWRLWHRAEPDKIGLGRHRSQPWDSFPDPRMIREQLIQQGRIPPSQRRRRVPRWGFRG